ncbi:glycosyltransferase family 4 protein [Neptuniibacter sp.]|uniref:glycosyltransferase family 4 protein n=1 Tax=Neptuniibacter sp. TaxID=1962643 RepID=UPI0026108C5A|nr:glycosyltransferase family 4 protein [Neptuniibacter sp.]MCP4596440.1 glycosyltransferase family 4 protein [Neptuniibacter sp.]
MKLALCLFKYFPYGGLQRNFLTIAMELLNRGHDVTVYTGAWEGEKPEQLKVKILSVKRLSNHSTNCRFHRELQQHLKDDPVDLVIGFNKMPDLDVYYCADTCFATKVYEDKPFFYRLLPRSRWSLTFEKGVFDKNLATETLLLSQNEGEAYKKYYDTQPERFHLMPPGINRNRIRTESGAAEGAAVRESLGISPEHKVVGFLGSDYKRKGLDRMLHAISALPEDEKSQVRALVIGRDKRLPDYQKLAKQLGIADQVIFVGQRDDVPQLLFACDLLMHPAYLENTGNVILEAVVAGLPVICTANCGYAFYIRDNQLGSVVDMPFKQQELDQALLDLLTSDINWQQRCGAFAESADIYSRPLRAAECIERIGEQRCQ